MKQTLFTKSAFHTILLIAGTIILSLLGLLTITHHDNKYITKAALTQDNLCIIPEKGYCSLVDGWELYPDLLLFPEDFTDKTPSYYSTWAGEYPNLSLFHENKSPYGVATWRLHLTGSGNVLLYLQEPLCAARVYVDGLYLGETGEVPYGEHSSNGDNSSGGDYSLREEYSPLIKDTDYSFYLGGETELIIQTANYSHYYGGIWYAPVIGDADGVSHLIASRMLIYGLLFFSSLTLSLFCIVLWERKEDGGRAATFYFGMLSLSFAVRICYPFLRLFGVPLVRTLYAIEDAAAVSGIFFSIQIALLLFLPDGLKCLKKALHILSLGVCGIVIIAPLFVFPAVPGLVLWYGPFISWYKAIMAVLLISLTVYGAFMGLLHIKIILAAAIANGICLFYSVLTIGYYEPFAGAYPEEYGAFCMVIAFAVLMVQRSREMAAENLKLNLHLQEEVEEKTEHLQKLLVERGQLIAELGHDMKSPLTSLSNMAQIIRLNDIMLDEDTHRRMILIEEQCDILSERLKSIQKIADQTSSPVKMEPMLLNTFLSDFYHTCRPIIELYGPNFFENITSHPCRIMANREQLFRALENLLYNAADFTPPEGKIILSLTTDENYAYIMVSDTGCGIPEKDLPNIFRRSYTTRIDKGGQGLGLAITRTIVLEHAGQIDAVSTEGEGTTFTIRLPVLD
ncbi:MAG: HAMP domain-containing histidine kinase [Lachnospiraceae bacterium]|nr:HAMP domain-containing histidine kinase [Lachnospiraceae bacterium]